MEAVSCEIVVVFRGGHEFADMVTGIHTWPAGICGIEKNKASVHATLCVRPPVVRRGDTREIKRAEP
jgi:hypothetical protein